MVAKKQSKLLRGEAIAPATPPAPEFAPSDYMTLTAAANIMPGRPSPTTIWRWATHGTRVLSYRRSGASEFHRLDTQILRTIRVGRRLFTTDRWIREFLADCETVGHPRAATTGPKIMSHAQAERQLQEAGL